MEASWTYGFCRVAPNAQTALVFLSKLPWHEAFYKMLNHAAELITYHSQDELFSFLHASHICKVPENGQMFHVSWLTDKNVMSDFAVETPHQLNLPTLPENVSQMLWKNVIWKNSWFSVLEKYEWIFQRGQTKWNDDNFRITAAWTKNRCDFKQIIEINSLRSSGQHADVSHVLATYFHTGVAQKVSRLLKCSDAFSDWCSTSINEGKSKQIQIFDREHVAPRS